MRTHYQPCKPRHFISANVRNERLITLVVCHEWEVKNWLRILSPSAQAEIKLGFADGMGTVVVQLQVKSGSAASQRR